MAPKILRASPKPTGRPVKKAKATGKPKGSSPSMILGSASKAGMQSKQGRNFLLPKSKPKRPIDRPKIMPRPPRKIKPEFERGTPLPRKVKTPDQLRKFMEKVGNKMGPDKMKISPKLEKEIRRLIKDRKRNK